MFKRKFLISVVIPITVLLGSCGANFQSVEDFSKSKELIPNTISL